MTKDTNKENVLKVIRYIQDNVEGLKELSFGCIIANEDGDFRIDESEVYPMFIHKNTEHESVLVVIKGENRTDFEIIGHEPQLNHLLLAVNNAEIEQDIEDLYMEILNRYDLTKTVEENLKSNPELCLYLLDLFQLTTNN